MPITQDNHRIAVTTPLGKDTLLLIGFTGREEISRLFSFRLDMLSESDGLAAKDIVGKSVTWTVKHADGTNPRYFNGMVSRFTAGPKGMRELRHYQAEVVPWLWFLTRTADCRIFQNKTAPQIIEQIFKDLGFSAYKLTLQGSYAKREYCVQYRETDFNFVSRLMEEEGIFYFFKHESGKHTLTLADKKSAYADCTENEVAYSGGGALIPNHINRWEHGYEFRPGKWAQTDYNFETPATDLMTTSTTTMPIPDSKSYEVYDYPGEYAVKADGTELTKIRMEEEEAAYEVAHGASGCRTFTPGGKFTLKKHDCTSEQGKGYVLTALEHAAVDETYTAGASGAQTYSNTFTCIPATVQFRPARTTPRPVVKGPQTAVVVGTKGEEIYTDKYGRVKVQFFWDREGKKDENSSCWIRVSQGWAGKNWGILFLPRIGQEVVVDFLEGDPDRPLITGRVYNAEQMPPYALPANQTQSVVKTRSSKGGGADNFNELRFEDKKGSEEVYFHAEKDFNRVVENNDTLKVGSDKADDGSQTIEIWKNRTETVKEGDEQVTIKKGKRTITVETGDDSHQVKKGNRSVTVDQGNDTHEVKQGNRTVTVGTGDDTHEVKTGKRTVTVAGDDTHQVKQGNREVKIDMGNDTLTISMGNQTTKLNLGQSSTEAMQGIELKVGQSSVKIDQTGVTIKGMMIAIEGQIQTQVKGTMVQVNGQAMAQIQGGIVMIG
jgi:type VI secretion system secreted protein VgrG